MSQPKTNKPKAQKISAPADIYTLLMLIAFLALLIGCVLLYLELSFQGPNPLSGVSFASPVWNVFHPTEISNPWGIV